MTLVTYKEVVAAADYVRPWVRRTPTLRLDALSHLAGRTVTLKAEHLQRTGSFKVRGALNRLRTIPKGAEVVAASAGNHAQGVALAATIHNIRAVVFMPKDAPLPKVEATRHYGARVRLVGGGVDDCIAAALAEADDRGAVFVAPFDDPAVIAGQGSVGIEIAEQVADAEAVVVPIGGGGLIAGVAIALRELRPEMRIIGVEANGAAAMKLSVESGRLTSLESANTIADGIALKSPSELTFAHAREYVDEIVTVTDEEIAEAVVVLLERAKSAVEPAGASPVAALLAGRIDPSLSNVCLLTSGGNVDPLVLSKIIEFGLAAAGRYLMLRVSVEDRPGALVELIEHVAEMGLNIVSVEHNRHGRDRALNSVDIVLHVEARGPEHQRQVIERLSAEFELEVIS